MSDAQPGGGSRKWLRSSGALRAFGGDGAEFFDGEQVFFAADGFLGGDEVFEGDQGADSAKERDGDGVLTEAGEVADAFDAGKHVQDAAVGFRGTGRSPKAHLGKVEG